MIGIVKSIIDKLKIKEILGTIFIVALCLTFIPDKWAKKMEIKSFIKSYRTYISLCLIIIGSYYILSIVSWIKKCMWKKIYNWKKVGIDYMKRNLSPDEMKLLIDAFYDKKNDVFRSSGLINGMDGRKAALENKQIIYLASNMGSLIDGFPYNLQPYALKFLNKNLREGNIMINNKEISFRLR